MEAGRSNHAIPTRETAGETERSDECCPQPLHCERTRCPTPEFSLPSCRLRVPQTTVQTNAQSTGPHRVLCCAPVGMDRPRPRGPLWASPVVRAPSTAALWLVALLHGSSLCVSPRVDATQRAVRWPRPAPRPASSPRPHRAVPTPMPQRQGPAPRMGERAVGTGSAEWRSGEEQTC